MEVGPRMIDVVTAFSDGMNAALEAEAERAQVNKSDVIRWAIARMLDLPEPAPLRGRRRRQEQRAAA